MTKKAIVIICVQVCVLCLAGAETVCAQPNEPLYVIDHPTAGLLPHGFYQIRGKIGPETSFLGEFRVGFKDRFQIGASFGAQNVLGYGSPDLNDKLGFQARLRVIEESNAPALAVGFDSQGQGRYHGDFKRYDRKSMGLYVVVTKNYTFALGQITPNGGVSFTTEREDDNDPNIFFGLNWTIANQFSILLDIDAALNDNANESQFGQGGIYVDAGLRWYYGENLLMTLIFRDLTGNFGMNSSVGREFEIAFIEMF